VKHYNKMTRQSGMTLIELTVVLLVLVGLAGIMMPYVGSFVGKTHDATGAQNANRSGEAIVRYGTTHDGYPANFDSLLVGAGGATGALINYSMADIMMGGGSAAANYGWSAYDLTATGVTDNASVCGSIGKAGLGTVIDMDVGTKAAFNPTFDNEDGTLASVKTVTVAMNGTITSCNGSVVVMDPTFVEEAMGITVDADKTYVVFGLGQMNDAVGKTMQEAPVHFAKNADVNASKAYNRFVAIFAADHTAASSDAAGEATYVGTAMAMSAIVGAQKELANYYADAAANN